MALTKIDDRGLKTPIDLKDNEELRFGTTPSMLLRHNGSNGFLENSTGNLILRPVTNDDGVVIRANDEVELYYDGGTNPKLETKAAGVQITGQLMNFTSGKALALGDDSKAVFGSEDDAHLDIYYNTANSWEGPMISNQSGQIFYIEASDGKTGIELKPEHYVKLMYDGAEKFSTLTSGVSITGDTTTSGKFISNSSSSGDYIRVYASSGTGKWDIYGSGANLRISDNDSAGKTRIDSPVNIYNRDDSADNVFECFNDNGNSCAGFSQSSAGDGTIFAKKNDGTLSVYFRSDGASYFTGGNVGIGTDDPFNATGYGTLELSGTTGGCLTFSDDEVQKWEVYGGASEFGIYDRAHTRYNLKCHDNGDTEIFTGNLKVPNGKGIDFSNQTWTSTGNTDAEVFDHYEEGTFIPTLGGDTGDPTQSYANRRGSFVRIGNLVHVMIDVEMAASGVSGGSGNMLLGSLPYAKGSHGTAGTAGGGQAYGASFSAGFHSNLGSDRPTAAYIDDSSTGFYMMKNTTSVRDYCSASAITNGSRIIAGASYITTA